ncbi:hypothetical protein Mal4_48740 [Maioricimonas rarisocia]|uniref:Sulfatase n=1 Tax=Maioricimonas rarisocia TaxID=2528026 RepID=A0A517ZDF4_9PLAN|nr:DUF1501 domain-containing protein [Maioricimonas rarisocia]QDU40516.1 hypothetical protein Mal4_48740 [Maioricimonas rarisocia]
MLNINAGSLTSLPGGRSSRRTVLQAGGAGLLGLSLPRALAAEELASATGGRAKSVIFLFLFGGPSQLETFDMKPDAPDTIRGPFQPITSRTPGLRICEHLPKTANVSDRFCVIRTMSHTYNDHSGGGHYIQTGHRWDVPIGAGFNATPRDWPSIGSVVEYLGQQRSGGHAATLPSYMVVPNFLGRLQEYKVQLRRPGEYGGWLGRGVDPVTTAVDKRDAGDNPYWRDMTDEELTFQIQGLASGPGLTVERLRRQRSLLEAFDDARSRLGDSTTLDVYDRFQQRALDLVSSERTRTALDLQAEPAALRDRYGRHLFGQSTLMARRLIEAGVRFVTVHYDCVDGYSWDSHRNSSDVQKHLLPTMDQALSALLVDLEQRGLLDETLVVCMGEMGRTPKANASWGRNHWSTLFPAVLAGAGVRGGSVVGETDKDAAYAVTPPTSPEDLAATIYHAMGIDPELRLQEPEGRPVHIVDGGRPLLELFG